MLNWDRLRACGIDTGAGMACCAEDGEFYAEMLGEFVRDAAAKLGELERFCAARDWDNYRIRAHSLKSTSRTIGATALSQRAKIFIPFEPLKGFRQALAERERLANVTSRRDLSQEQREEISAKLSALSPGDMVRVSHYVEDHYELTVGQVVRVSVPDGTITVEKTTIRFGDLGSLDYL